LNFDFSEYVNESINNLHILHSSDFLRDFLHAGDLIIDSLSNKGKVLIAGNGGSHADAQHFAGELVNQFTTRHKGLPVITLGTNIAVATAWSNDHDFSSQFAREVQAYGDTKSSFIGITTSGRSANIVRALQQSHEMGMKTLVLTGERGKELLSDKADVILSVPGNSTHKIQESHIVVYHALCIYIESKLPQWLLA
jgi:D-sedoheptulose 7-phosphate isomerase